MNREPKTFPQQSRESHKKEADSGGLKFFRLRNTGNALGFNFESEAEKRKIVSSTQPSKKSRLLFEEVLETDFNGSFYHPNFVDFDINLENKLKQSKEKSPPNQTGELQNGYLNQFHIVSSFLKKKPYAFSLFADKSKDVENREFFERQLTSSLEYGGDFGYRDKFIPIGFSFANTTKSIDRALRPSQEFSDDKLNLNLNNDSKRTGTTRFEVNQDKFTRTETGVSEQSGTMRDFNLSNQKFFSQDNKKSLYSSLYYYDLAGTSQSSVLNLNEDFDIRHTDNLESSYTYNFSNRNSSGVKIDSNRLGATLTHKLYESLVSSLDSYYFNSDSTSSSQDIYSMSFKEDYTKKLGKIGRLSLGTGLNYSQEERKSPGGIISVIDESHTLTTGGITFLDKSSVDTSTVVVTDTTGTTTYVLTTDYLLTTVGQSIQIQRVPAGSITDGQNVLVDYQISSVPLLKFNTLGSFFNSRIDFLDSLIGIFYRVNKETHPRVSVQGDAVLQVLTDTVVGIDAKYKNFTTALENEYYDSSLSPYKELRLREAFFINPTEKSTLTFQSSQSIVRLMDTSSTNKFFDYTTYYTVALNKYSRFNFETGFRWQAGSSIDLDDWGVSPGYELDFDSFKLSAKYDFRRQLYIGDKLVSHIFSLKVKREF